MDTYSFLRQMADSWALLGLFLFFMGVIAWAFRPGSKKTHADIANVPFRNETLVDADADQQQDNNTPSGEDLK